MKQNKTNFRKLLEYVSDATLYLHYSQWSVSDVAVYIYYSEWSTCDAAAAVYIHYSQWSACDAAVYIHYSQWFTCDAAVYWQSIFHADADTNVHPLLDSWYFTSGLLG